MLAHSYPIRDKTTKCRVRKREQLAKVAVHMKKIWGNNYALSVYSKQNGVYRNQTKLAQSRSGNIDKTIYRL